MNRETIQLFPTVELSGFELARTLRDVHAKDVKKAFINELLGDLDDYAWEVVCEFVRANTDIAEKNKP